MIDHFENLVSLQNYKPRFNSCSSYSEFNAVLNRYTSALTFFNGYNDHYKTTTKVYFNDISSIRDNLQRSVDATDPREKASSFEIAGKELIADIQSLICLLKPAYAGTPT